MSSIGKDNCRSINTQDSDAAANIHAKNIDINPQIPTQQSVFRTPRELDDMDSAVTERQQKTGRWGEKFTFEYLRAHYKGKYSEYSYTESTSKFTLFGNNSKGAALNLEVIWHNESQESGCPYDLTITKNGERRYIDVKSTSQDRGGMAYISSAEWRFMKSVGNRYRLFCVQNAMQHIPSITKIKDPASGLQSGAWQPHRIQFKVPGS